MKVFYALAFALFLGGCSQSEMAVSSGKSSDTAPTAGGDTSAQATNSSDSTKGQAGTTGDTDKTAETPAAEPSGAAATGDDIASRKPKKGEEVAVMDTTLGKIVLMFFPDKAPKHVENFKKLAKSGFYNGTKFHRVIPGFMIQGGDPNTKNGDPSTWGQGGPKWNVKAEFNDVKHVRGILSMARSSDPDSAGSQFFIMVATYPSLDGQYSAFGKVVSGMEVADKIVNLPRIAPGELDRPEKPPVIKSLKIEKWPVK